MCFVLLYGLQSMFFWVLGIADLYAKIFKCKLDEHSTILQYKCIEMRFYFCLEANRENAIYTTLKWTNMNVWIKVVSLSNIFLSKFKNYEIRKILKNCTYANYLY